MKNDDHHQKKTDGCGTVTLRDIARELDISHATVSMALRDNPRISGDTKERVKQKAEEMGYAPDPALAALSHYRQASRDNPRSAVLAWIHPAHEDQGYAELIEFQLYRKGAEESARQLGFSLEEFSLEKQDLKSMHAEFLERNIQGIAVAPITSRTAPVDWSEFPWDDFSAIRFGRNKIGPPIRYVASAQVGNTILACRHMAEKGYRRIGYIGLRLGRMMYVAGYMGFQAELESRDKVAPLLVEYEEIAPPIEKLDAWMKTQRPEAILTHCPDMPEMLAGLGYSVPGDVALATTSIHDTPIDAGIDQNPEEIGAAAIRSLVAQVNEHHFGIPAVGSSILIEGDWVEGSMLPDRSRE
ncbi:LacI family DNA-binding transcriptional regulator [Pontiella sp.]|uniref:LacI family DNA-binding transcriptional regulator n=1 Tax=Pontiella sp. TaxID=2837462 RepID=UPI0035684149